ncbi:MAG: polyprenyl synthetase family protein [Trueperaceae bacterium]
MFELIAPDLRRFEERLPNELTSNVAFIEAIGEDLVAAGGKRLRPALAFLTGRLLAADPEATMQVALAVELLHSASLLHDDLIDDADTRRGSEAAFKRYGNVVSVMSGDFMLARVLGLLARTGSPEFTRLMSHTAAAICEGEVLQFQVASLADYSYENYQRVIEGKTAALLAAACEGVALLAGAPPAQAAALRAFALAYGRAFQMQDDYLDLLGDPERLGKPVGGDLREGKATYAVLVLLLDHDLAEARAIVERRAARPGDVERMIELIHAHGAHRRARDRIAQEAEAALAALQAFAPSPALNALTALAESERLRVG